MILKAKERGDEVGKKPHYGPHDIAPYYYLYGHYGCARAIEELPPESIQALQEFQHF